MGVRPLLIKSGRVLTFHSPRHYIGLFREGASVCTVFSA